MSPVCQLLLAFPVLLLVYLLFLEAALLLAPMLLLTSQLVILVSGVPGMSVGAGAPSIASTDQ